MFFASIYTTEWQFRGNVAVYRDVTPSGDAIPESQALRYDQAERLGVLGELIYVRPCPRENDLAKQFRELCGVVPAKTTYVIGNDFSCLRAEQPESAWAKVRPDEQ